MKIKKSFAILLILVLAFSAGGCGNEQYPKDVVAVVNGEIISEKEIDKEITERKMVIAFGNILSTIQPGSLTPKDALLEGLNINEEDLSPDQIRYIESRERTTTKLLSNNEALNILIRKEVLYQEALKEGYEVSVDEAKQILEESKQSTAEMLINDQEAQKQREILEASKKIYNQFGFQSEEDYLNQRIDKTAQALTINRMKNQFNNVITNKLNNVNGFQMEVERQNAWDDYGEYLLKKAKIKILNNEYSIEIYGEPWSYGTLDLKTK